MEAEQRENTTADNQDFWLPTLNIRDSCKEKQRKFIKMEVLMSVPIRQESLQ